MSSGFFGWIKKLFGGDELEVRKFRGTEPFRPATSDSGWHAKASAVRNEQPSQGMFASDEATAALHRLATNQADAKDWDGAIASLRSAHQRMCSSTVSYPAATWCRLPLYLQRAGRYDESMAAFDTLLADLSRRVRHDARLDDPNVGPAAQKQHRYERLLVDDGDFIREKKALAVKRQSKDMPKNGIARDRND